jgi:hypothetical protein
MIDPWPSGPRYLEQDYYAGQARNPVSVFKTETLWKRSPHRQVRSVANAVWKRPVVRPAGVSIHPHLAWKRSAQADKDSKLNAAEKDRRENLPPTGGGGIDEGTGFPRVSDTAWIANIVSVG